MDICIYVYILFNIYALDWPIYALRIANGLP